MRRIARNRHRGQNRSIRQNGGGVRFRADVRPSHLGGVDQADLPLEISARRLCIFVNALLHVSYGFDGSRNPG